MKFFLILYLFTNILCANPLGAIDEEYAEQFSKLLVQSKDGRVKPLDTQNLDIFNKIISKKEFEGVSYNQIVLGMTYLPDIWKNVELFDNIHIGIRELLHVKEKVSFNQLFDEKGSYLLEDEVTRANGIKEEVRTSYDRAILKLDEKIKITQYIFSKGFMRIFPLKNSINSTWYSPLSLKENFSNATKYEAQLLYVKNKKAIEYALLSGDWSKAMLSIKEIANFQQNYGSNLLLSERKIDIEILYNRILIFDKIYPVYFVLGLLLVLLMFIEILNKKSFKNIEKIVFVSILFIFLLHSLGLAVRWYISGYAPWSNAYESMLFISWSIVLSGLLFYRKSLFALGSVSMLGGVLLFVAHLSWLDPQIYTLPVNLQSLWLTIHVAVISTSYGFLALSALLGIIALILLVLDTYYEVEIKNTVNDLIRTNELSMIIGLSLLTIGTLLGSVWANEAWGRIWGWDPKEVWSLISILIYMLVLHIRLIPKLFTVYIFSVLSIISYSAIIMTYFGVNYFFDAIHVYASKSGHEVPDFTYYVIGIVLTLFALSYKNRKYQC